MSFSTERRGSLPFILPTGHSSSLHGTPGPTGYSPHKTPSPGGTPLAAAGAHRLPTTSPPSERLRRLAPKPVMIPPTPPIPLVLGGALRRGSRGKVREAKDAGSVQDGKEGKERRKSEARAPTRTERVRESGEEGQNDDSVGLGISGFTFGDGPPAGSSCVKDQEADNGELEGFEFAPMMGAATYDPERASRENSYISYKETRDASFSTASSFGFDKYGSPDDLAVDAGAGEMEPYEYGVASPRSVDARRRAPDVPEEAKYTRSSPHRSYSAQPLSGGSRGLLSGSSGSGGDEIDSFFLDMRPAARQGDELLSPQTYLANHTPRAVLVQFRDVFGGGDTIAPHLPAIQMPGGPDDAYTFPPRHNPITDVDPVTTATSVEMNRTAALASSFSETFGIGKSAATVAHDVPLESLDRPSMDLDSLRAPSRADSGSSFSFSAYMMSENGEAETESIKPRMSEEQVRQRSTSLHRRPRYVDRLVPDLTFGDSPAMEDLVTPEIRTNRLASDATDFSLVASQQSDNGDRVANVGLGLGLNMDDSPSPTPRSGRSATFRSKSDIVPKEAAAGKKPLQVNLSKPFTAPPGDTLAPDSLSEQSRTGKSGAQRPTTSAVHHPPQPRHYKSFPNIAKRPCTAPDHAKTSMVQQQHPLPVPDSTLASSTSHASISTGERSATSRKAKGKAIAKPQPDPLSAKSVAEAQQAKEGKPFEDFRVDGFNAGPKDSRWKGNLKADVQIGGLTVGRYTTINLWADQQARESISTLYPVRLHTPARAKQLDAEIGGSQPTPSSGKGKKDAQMSPSNNASDAFYRDGCVEFGMDPRGRDKWMFKHGSMEALPRMSRLTINGSQNLDYLSRHISLHIRETGIYTVRGSEKEGAEWRMRYMVNKAPPCLRPEDRCIVIMAFYVNGPFLRGLHANKVGLATSFAKSFKPDIHAMKASTPELIQASQVPTVPEVRLDPVEDDATTATHVAQPPVLSTQTVNQASGSNATSHHTPVPTNNLPRRSTSIKRTGVSAIAPVTPLRQQRLGLKGPHSSGRRPSTANPSVPHGTPGSDGTMGSPVGTAAVASKGKESLMATVRKRAATVWTRPITGTVATSPPLGNSSPSFSPPVKSVLGLGNTSPSAEPPSSAASGGSFGSAISNLLKSKRSLANLKRAPDFAMSPAVQSMSPFSGGTAEQVPRIPLSAKSANHIVSRGGLTPSASARFASHQPPMGHGTRHMRTFSANAAPCGVELGGRLPKRLDREEKKEDGEAHKAWTLDVEQVHGASDGSPASSRRLDKSRVQSRPPVSGAHRHGAMVAKRRPSTANDVSVQPLSDTQRVHRLKVDMHADDVLRVRGGRSAEYLSLYDRQRFEIR